MQIMNTVKKIPLDFFTFMTANVIMHLPHISPSHEMIARTSKHNTSYVIVQFKLV